MTNAKSANPLTRFLDQWRKQFADVDEKAFGVVIPARNSAIDDGEYGDPMEDKRPDFIRRDEEGWTRLK